MTGWGPCKLALVCLLACCLLLYVYISYGIRGNALTHKIRVEYGLYRWVLPECTSISVICFCAKTCFCLDIVCIRHFIRSYLYSEVDRYPIRDNHKSIKTNGYSPWRWLFSYRFERLSERCILRCIFLF